MAFVSARTVHDRCRSAEIDQIFPGDGAMSRIIGKMFSESRGQPWLLAVAGIVALVSAGAPHPLSPAHSSTIFRAPALPRYRPRPNGDRRGWATVYYNPAGMNSARWATNPRLFWIRADFHQLREQGDDRSLGDPAAWFDRSQGPDFPGSEPVRDGAAVPIVLPLDSDFSRLLAKPTNMPATGSTLSAAKASR